MGDKWVSYIYNNNNNNNTVMGFFYNEESLIDFRDSLLDKQSGGRRKRPREVVPPSIRFF
jgi:hypothetical protein